MTVGQVSRTAVPPAGTPGSAGGDRPTRPPWWRSSSWVVAAAIGFAAIAIPMFGRQYVFFDMRIYHGAMEWWAGGGALYEFIAPNTTLGFTYPPFAALVMLPMAAMPAIAAGWVNTVVSVVALALVLAVLLLPIADRCGWPRWPTLGVALPLAIAMEPTRETLGFGQVNLLLFALVVADLVGLRWAARREAGRVADRRDSVRVADRRDSGRVADQPRRVADQSRRVPEQPRRWGRSELLAVAAGSAPAGWARDALRRLWHSGAWAGVGIGLATAVKLTPGLFILYLLVSRQRRPALVAIGTAIGASLASVAVAPRESITYFTSVVWQTDRVGAADFTPNQSLAGLLARLYDSQETPGLMWLSFAALCCALGLSRAVAAHKDGDELAAFTLVGLTATVISPISWTHHLVFVIPAVVILGDAALRRHTASRGFGLVPTLAGLRYGTAALAVYALFVVSPLWWVYHRLPEGSHYDSGLPGLLAENSLALGVILLVALMPWRPGAEPAPALFTPTRRDHGLRYMVAGPRRP